MLYVAKLPDSEGAKPGPKLGPKLGMTVSRRIGNAVTRNRLRRRVRECFRLSLRESTPSGCALVVAARVGAGELVSDSIYAELTAATLRLVKRFGQQERDEVSRRN